MAIYCSDHRKGLDINDLQAIWIEVTIWAKKLLIAAVYRSPSADNEILRNFHMTQLTTEPTHITPNSSILIDIIATTSLDLVNKKRTHSPSLSNHSDVMVKVLLKRPKVAMVKRKIYDYSKTDWAKLKHQTAGPQLGKYTDCQTYTSKYMNEEPSKLTLNNAYQQRICIPKSTGPPMAIQENIKEHYVCLVLC